MRHPEQRDDELFLGDFYLNSSQGREDYENVTWRSKRLGDETRSDAGRLLPVPVACFIKREEVEAEIASAEEPRKAILQAWLKNLENGK